MKLAPFAIALVTAIVSGSRQAGIDATEAALSAALARDPEARANFPSMYVSATGADENNQMSALLTAQIGTADIR